jgi:hypothetical protein
VSDSRKPLDHWLPPEGAGAPLACLATSFSFDVDFFEQQCLGRFLGLDWKRDEGGEAGDIAFLVEQEEKLAETRVSVIVDRGWAVEGRSLRWDLLPVGVEGGVMHAKVCLLVWENLVRCVIGSANLTPAGYRRQLETQVVLDASADDGPPSAVMAEAIAALRELAGKAGGNARQEGPKQKAIATLRDAERRLASFGDRVAGRGDPRVAIALGAPGRPVLDALERVWRGGPARSAVVLSPFFDAPGKDAAALDLLSRLAQRGTARLSFVVETEQLDSRTRVKAPQSLLAALPDRVGGALLRLDHDDEDDELRRLHAKAIRLESDGQVALLIGSSNFTAAGLGIDTRGNLEVNIAIGAVAGSEVGRGLEELIPAGDPVDLEEADWEPDPPEDEPEEPQLPWGFEEALLDPLPTATLRLRLDRRKLPPSWTVAEPGGAAMVDSREWEKQGSPRELEVPLAGSSLPFFLRVSWPGPEGDLAATWPVNVTDKASLPPPEELRNLPVDALLQALASIRPLHEGLSEAIRGREGRPPADELDPLARFSATGQLMRRVKLASQAFSGLRARMERPAASEEALLWRLNGPFGPKAIAEGLIERAEAGGAVAGETSFLLAELALTLSRVDWRKTGRLLPGGTRLARESAAATLAGLHELRRGDGEDELLAAYVERAFREATL